MNKLINPILRDQLIRLDQQFIKDIAQAKEFFSTSLCSGYRNKICEEYCKHLEKLGECIFSHLTSKEKKPEIFNNIFFTRWAELKERLKLDLDGHSDNGTVDETYKRILDRYIYEINLFLEEVNNSHKEKIPLGSSTINQTNNITITGDKVSYKKNKNTFKVVQTSSENINPEPEKKIIYWLKKIWSFVLSLF